MKAFLFLLAMTFLLGSAAYSQKELPPAFEINTDTVTYFVLPYANWQYFEEKDRKLTISDIIKPAIGSQFKNPDSPIVSTGTPGRLWLRYRIRNNLSKPLGITLPEEGERADFYISGDTGKSKHYVTGSTVAWRKRDGLKKMVQVTHIIPANSSITVYEAEQAKLESNTRYFVGITSNVIAKNYMQEENASTGDISYSILTGFFFFAAIFNFFLYYIVREKVYLLYSILLLLSGPFSPPLIDLFIREVPEYRPDIMLFSRGIIIYLLLLTLLGFLQASKNYPVLTRWLLRLYWPIIILGAFLLNTYRYHYQVSILITDKILPFIAGGSLLFIFVGLIIIIVTDLIKKRRASQLFILAIAPFLLFLICYLIGNLAKIVFEWKYIYETTIIWAVSVISWSLFERLNMLLNENAQQAFDKEKILREKEEERSQLITMQNERLEQQVAERTAELSHSLAELKQTQSQLIQSAKLASLGELTVGIAHEIQNPLNFVNNFSEVSVELVDEMQTELSHNNPEEAEAIASDIRQNLEKIHHLGKRADAIVKNMLQHSHNSGGGRQLTDINSLADEHLRLSYHGLRTKDQSFNAAITTHFEQTLPKIQVVPQDIGRVLLNLFNNALYSVNQKRKTAPSDYQPELTVSTTASNGQLHISVRDNGTGIADNIKAKILQPFFTTKPTGEGTGLGLSLSYDIITKGHGGTIQIHSVEGEYAEFIVSLPE